MDAERFDHISKAVSSDPTRRRVLAALLGGGLTALALAPAGAKKKKKGKKKKGGSRVCASATGNCQPECTFDTECGLFGKYCEGGKCVDGCRNDTYCRVVGPTMVEVCEHGQCVPGCLDNDFQCPGAKICSVDHHCMDGCLSDNECVEFWMVCRNGRCGPECAQDSECGQQGQVCHGTGSEGRCAGPCNSSIDCFFTGPNPEQCINGHCKRPT